MCGGGLNVPFANPWWRRSRSFVPSPWWLYTSPEVMGLKTKRQLTENRQFPQILLTNSVYFKMSHQYSCTTSNILSFISFFLDLCLYFCSFNFLYHRVLHSVYNDQLVQLGCLLIRFKPGNDIQLPGQMIYCAFIQWIAVFVNPASSSGTEGPLLACIKVMNVTFFALA